MRSPRESFLSTGDGKEENTTLFKRAKKPYQQDKQGYSEVLGLSLPEYICRASRVELTSDSKKLTLHVVV